jgi:hypothetical protein
VGAVGPHEVGEPCSLLARRSREVCGDAVGVLFEVNQLDTPLNLAAELPQSGGEQSFGDVLGQRDEPERHIRRDRQVQAGDLPAVDEHQLTPHRRGGVQNSGQTRTTAWCVSGVGRA